jgi:hypothetical protein
MAVAKASNAKKAAPARRGSETAKILDLLKRPGGVTLEELIQSYGLAGSFGARSCEIRKAGGWRARLPPSR